TERFVQLPDRERADVPSPATTADLQGERGDVDPDHLQPSLLKLQQDPTRSTADVEAASTRQIDPAPLMGRPCTEGPEIGPEVTGGDGEKAVVPLDELGLGAAFQTVEEGMSEGIATVFPTVGRCACRCHPIGNMLVASPCARGGGSLRPAGTGHDRL